MKKRQYFYFFSEQNIPFQHQNKHPALQNAMPGILII